MNRTSHDRGGRRPLAARGGLVVAAMLAFAVLHGCTPNRRIMEAGATPVPPPPRTEPTQDPFEADLQAMRNADFKFVLVFRRTDDGPMDAEDKAFMNANTPPDANRRKLSDDGRAIIVGSNFPFYPGTVTNLTRRFKMDDFSKPDAGPLEVDRLGGDNTNTVPDVNARPDAAKQHRPVNVRANQ